MTTPSKETAKTIAIGVQATVIAILVTGILAFVGGMHYQKHLASDVRVVTTTTPLVKK